MAGRGGIYKGPDGDDLHGDGTPVERSSGTLSSGMVMHLQHEGEKAIAELTRLTALLEDRQALTHVLREAWREWETMGNKPGVAEFQADRLIAYLKPLG